MSVKNKKRVVIFNKKMSAQITSIYFYTKFNLIKAKYQ